MIRKVILLVPVFIFIVIAAGACSKGSGNNDNRENVKDPVTRAYNDWLARGESSLPDVIRAAESEEWRMRSHAMLALGRLGNQNHVSLALKRLKKDTSKPVRNSAVIALGDLKAKSAVQVLIPMLDEESRVSSALVAESLGKIGNDEAVKPLYTILYQNNRALRLKVVEALVRINDPLASRLIMKDMKKIRKHGLEGYAARILGEMPVPGAEKFCIALAGSGSVPEQTSAIVALGKMRSPGAVPVLVNHVKNSPELLRERSAESLIQIDALSSVDPLVKLLGSPEKETAMTSARVLSRLSAHRVESRVFALFRENPAANGPAAYVLGRKKFRKAIPLLRSRLENETQAGRNEMARALGWMNDRPSVPLLMEVAETRKANGAHGAVWALGQLKAGKAVPLLISILEDDNRQLVAESIAALGSIGDKRAVKPIIRLYYGTGDAFAPYVTTALAKIGGERVREFVRVNIESGDQSRQRMAGQLLLRLKDPELKKFGIKMLDHGDDLVRGYGVEYLKSITGHDFRTISEWKEWAKDQK
ncbi:MAG: HEAT repeat domain-containing protein [Spirochaetota bacterium]